MLSLTGEELEIELPVPPSNQTASRSWQQLIFGLCLYLTVVAHNSLLLLRLHQNTYYKYYGLWGGSLFSHRKLNVQYESAER